jgi:hypothetical protein
MQAVHPYYSPDDLKMTSGDYVRILSGLVLVIQFVLTIVDFVMGSSRYNLLILIVAFLGFCIGCVMIDGIDHRKKARWWAEFVKAYPEINPEVVERAFRELRQENCRAFANESCAAAALAKILYTKEPETPEGKIIRDRYRKLANCST